MAISIAVVLSTGRYRWADARGPTFRRKARTRADRPWRGLSCRRHSRSRRRARLQNRNFIGIRRIPEQRSGVLPLRCDGTSQCMRNTRSAWDAGDVCPIATASRVGRRAGASVFVPPEAGRRHQCCNAARVWLDRHAEGAVKPVLVGSGECAVSSRLRSHPCPTPASSTKAAAGERRFRTCGASANKLALNLDRSFRWT